MSRVAVSKIIGIDLGTTNSAAAVMMGGEPTIIPSAEGITAHGKMFPSVVVVTNDGQRLVGGMAKMQALVAPERAVMAIKREMGTDYSVKIDDKEYTPQEISAMILQKIKGDAEDFLGEEITKAVITVPAYFNDNQRQATKDAGTIAGLEVVRLINEPTAASLAYGLDKEEELRIAVLDLGGGTFDITIMEMRKGIFKVISTSGDTRLGGIDMDNKIVGYLLDELKERNFDLNKIAVQRLRHEAEKAKIELSSTLSTTVNIPASTNTSVNITLTRAKLEKLIGEVVDMLDRPMKQALADAKLEVEDIEKVILVGGPTIMPIVQERFKRFFGREPERGIDPMKCVAMGAAIQGGVLAGDVEDLVLLDVTPLSLGIETSGGVFTKLIDRNTIIPVEESEIFTTAEDGQREVAIHVLQGERPMAADNITLGLFHLTDIPPAPRGEPMIDVTFDIDADCILRVSAEDLETGRKQKVTISASTKLSNVKIERMIKDAERFARADKKRREIAEVRNQAMAVIYEAEKNLSESKISGVRRENAEEGIENLKEALKKGGVEKIKKYMRELSKIEYK